MSHTDADNIEFIKMVCETTKICFTPDSKNEAVNEYCKGKICLANEILNIINRDKK